MNCLAKIGLIGAFMIAVAGTDAGVAQVTVPGASDDVSTGLVRPVWMNPESRIAPVPAVGEFFVNLEFEPGVRVMVQAPGGCLADIGAAGLPVHVIFYLLPNGNTSEQTFGRRMNGGLDRRYGIQHVAAQTRRVRELLAGRRTVVTVTMETDVLSWPAWRRDLRGANVRLVAMVDEVRKAVGATTGTADLVAHSGGGSFVWGFLNAYDRLPDWLERVTLLDANYSFSEEDGHGEKLLDWLAEGEERRLYVVAYDDRYVELDGKRIVSDTGGTWRATDRMGRALERRLDFRAGQVNDLVTSAALGGRVLLARHPNRDLRILHTVLVEKNGLVHCTVEGRAELEAGDWLYGAEAEKECYRRFILP